MPGYQPRHDTDPVWFNGTQVNTLTITSAQAGVRITAVHGWDDRPDIRDVRSLRSGQDGEYADNLYLGGRTITLEGEVYGSTWANLQSRKRALAALFVPQSDEVLLKIPDPATASPTTVYATTGMTGYERASVRVVEAIRFSDSLDPCCQVFQVVLRASDPRIYSDVETSTDSGTTGTSTRTVTLDQSGTYETPVDLTVTGPTASNISVTADDLTLVLDGLTLTSTESVTFDTRDRTIEASFPYDRVRTRTGSLVAGWLLAESAGTTADNYQGTATYDGTYSGTLSLSQSGPNDLTHVSLTSNGCMYVAYNAALNPTNATYEMWFRVPTTDATQRFLFSSKNSNHRGVEVSSQGNGLVIAYGRNSGANTQSNTYNNCVRQNTWHHLAVTLGASGRYVYVDGVQVSGDAGFTDYSPATSEELVWGGSLLAGSPMGTSGLHIGPCALFNTQLSTTTIEDLSEADTLSVVTSAYSYLLAESATWDHLGSTSEVFQLASTGLNTGSKLNATYRDARL